jgi:hypothetical protein
VADQQWNVALPPGLVFNDGYKIQVQALDPTTGAFVSGVQVRNLALQVSSENPDELVYGPFMLVTGPQVEV